MGPRPYDYIVPGAHHSSRQQGPCTDDRLRFCSVTADPDAIRVCLLQHKNELSGACEARLQEEPSTADQRGGSN